MGKGIISPKVPEYTLYFGTLQSPYCQFGFIGRTLKHRFVCISTDTIFVVIRTIQICLSCQAILRQEFTYQRIKKYSEV